MCNKLRTCKNARSLLYNEREISWFRTHYANTVDKQSEILSTINKIYIKYL